MEQLIADNILTHLNDTLCRIGKKPVKYYPCVHRNFPDGYLLLFGKRRPVEIKDNLTLGRVPLLCRILKPPEGILFTSYVTASVAKMLQAEHVEYVDMAGNMFLCNGDSIILIQNCEKPAIIERRNSQGRAWTPAGLKVLFLLLTDKDALNWNYRKISEYSGVSLGSVKYVMTDLQERQLLLELNDRLHWSNHQKMITQWSTAYAEKILPRIVCKHYTGTLPETLTPAPLAVSGESFAQKQNLMTSNRKLLWQYGNMNEFIARNRLRPDEHGNIEVREAFWPEVRNFGDTVPYLLVYADLLAENDSRCAETAQVIYERYLEED
jgi:hypothetical protein